jgi:malonyl-CoA decarboxylase
MNDNVPRTSTVRTLWGWLTGSGRPPAEDGKSLAAADLRGARATLREMLAGTGGEASARRRVQLLAQLYRGANDAGRCAFLKLMATDFGPEPVAVARAVEAYLGASLPERPRAEAALRIALGSPRIRILKQFNLLGDGVKFLVDLRADVLRFVRAAPQLEAIDEELLSLLASWFDIGNLELARISWQSPAALLEKLIAYEAVHEIRSWTDLRNRLDMDRRCYAFFHPRMPEEPLIFVEIALVKEMASNIHALLDETAPAMDPHTAQAALFYSISTTQPGLRGVSFGTFLVKRVVQQLALDFPKLKTFATLSPVPGLRKWLEARLTEKDPSLLDKQEAAKLTRACLLYNLTLPTNSRV